MTHFEIKSDKLESDEINKWIRDHISGLEKKSVIVTTKFGHITEIKIEKTLTVADKKKIIEKFPELEGKEIG